MRDAPPSALWQSPSSGSRRPSLTSSNGSLEETKDKDRRSSTSSCKESVSSVEHEAEDGPSHHQDPEKPRPTWSSLPRKDQLLILTLARLSEPLTQTSLQSYMYYQLRSFAPDASDSTISYQAGMLAAAFTGAQFLTAIAWGRLADSERMGRKKVILVGVLGTAIYATAFGFSRSFAACFFWRAFGGALNGNIGVMRTMISEIIRDKKHQPRAFLLLPMTFNIGVIIGPILGGLLADPSNSLPSLFAENKLFLKFPYSLPNLVSAAFLLLSAAGVFLGLEESHETLKDKRDIGLDMGRFITRTIFRRGVHPQYQALSNDETNPSDMEMQSPTKPPEPPRIRRKLPFRRIWTRNVIITYITYFCLASHAGTFNSLWFVFLSTPRYIPTSSDNNTNPNAKLGVPIDYTPHAPFTFTGGPALPPARIGTALAILGVIGISLQLLLYPKVSFQLGTTRSFRWSLCLFPLSYFLTPFISAVHSSTSPPGPASGTFLWLSIIIVLAVQVTARTFALPASAILVNNASPHPSVLGTIHGIGQSVSSAARTIGPVVMAYIYGVGLQKGVVGLAFWCMAGMALSGAVLARFVSEGDGHEIWLEGEKEEAEEEIGLAGR